MILIELTVIQNVGPSRLTLLNPEKFYTIQQPSKALYTVISLAANNGKLVSLKALESPAEIYQKIKDETVASHALEIKAWRNISL